MSAARQARESLGNVTEAASTLGIDPAEVWLWVGMQRLDATLEDPNSREWTIWRTT